jgi:hypothetical protein
MTGGPAVLTASSTLTCPHSGKVAAASTSRLRVGTVPVLLAPAAGKSVDGCPVVDDPNTSTLTCRLVASVSAGESSKLTVGGTSVLLAVLAGLTNGTPPPTGAPLAPAAPGSTRLRAAPAVA